MPWTSDGPSAGFSAAEETWLPVDPAHRPLAAEAQEDDPDSTLNFIRRLIALRAAWPALRRGEAKVMTAPPGVLALERRAGDDRLICLFDLVGDGVEMAVEPETVVLDAFNGAALSAPDRAVLPPFGGLILRGPA